MKKLIVLLATASLAFSNCLFAARTNPNDVLQTLPGGNGNHTVLADASTDQQQMTQNSTQKPVKQHHKKYHKKHHNKQYKKHHHQKQQPEQQPEQQQEY